MFAGVAAITLAVPAIAAPTLAPRAADAPVPVASLVKAVDIPYQEFTLANGLRVVVHTDRKAPVVAVSVWYDVGSKHEPAGRTGFAHLFEHLMFNGSENAPGDFFEPLKEVGATDYNGTTYFDRTNYFETVPTAALDRALFLESDRMGHLTGAITQAVLDEQRGVVQNEKRQGDNQPYGLVQYKLTDGLFPKGHPYGHSTIGSMADLDRASVADVKNWFHDHYGPNNAVLVLAGDIDVATARALVEKYFGAIPRGPASVAPPAPVPTLPTALNETMTDRVAAPLILKAWTVPGVNDPDSIALDVAARVLGGLASSRLDNALVKGEKIAVQVGAQDEDFAQLGTFTVSAFVKPGVDPALVSRRIDAVLAELIAKGPTADEVARVVTQSAAGRIAGLESVGGFGGKAVALAQGELYSGDPGFYKKELAALAAQTPETVRAAMQKWLTRPAYALTVMPGARAAYAEAEVPPAVPVVAAPPAPVKGDRGPLPPVGTVSELTFPAVTRATLTNGITLVYAQRDTVPMTRAAISFDAGSAADVAAKPGTQQLTVSMMDEGTPRYDSIALAEARERLGMSLGGGSNDDRTSFTMLAPSANLAPAVDLLADVVRHPAFPAAELARVKTQQIAGIAQELTSPEGIAARALAPVIYGPDNPYRKGGGSGDADAVATLGRDDLIAFQRAWLRPDKATLFVVSDRPLAEVRAVFDRAFGDWRATGVGGTKPFPETPYQPPRHILLIDRPDSPQSLIVGAMPTPLRGTRDMLPALVANDALGGGFLSRLNLNLREDKHWSYGASGGFDRNANAAPYVINAPVQADRTGDSIAELRRDIAAFVTDKPMTDAEFARTITGSIRSLSGSFETSGDVLSAMQTNDLLKRPDDYYATLATRYRALTRPQVSAAITAALDPATLTWIVVGEAATVKPQLDSLGLPVEVVPTASVADATEKGTP